MVGSGHVYDILRAPCGHVAIDASGRTRVFPRRDLFVEGRVMALAADCGVMPICLVTSRNIVRIVASRAEQLAVALQKTCRAPQAISRVDDLELVFPAGTCRVVEVEDEPGHG